MATRVDTFYPSSTDQDFTATGEVDIRKLSETLGSSDNTTIASVTDAAAEIVLDPYTTRSTTGTTDAPNLGWAINRDGADGMAVPTPPAGVDTAERFIAAGTWTFNSRLGVSLLSIANVRLRIRVYRVASDGSRTLLFGPINSNTVTPTVVGVDVAATSSQSEITFSEDETLLVSYAIEKTNTGLGTGGSNVELRLNDGIGNDTEIILPAGIRTRYAETRQVNAVGTAIRDPQQVDVARTVNGVGTASMSRTVTASRTITVNGVGTVTRANAITKAPITVNGVATVSGRIEVPIDEIPDDGDFSGSDPTAAVAGTVYDEDQAIAVGATVLLFRQSDNLFIGSTITDAAGAYSFTRDTADPNEYYVVAFVSDTSHGSSNRSLAPA